MRIKTLLVYLFVLVLACLTGCATSLPNTTTEEINHQKVEYALTQKNTIPVVFENGLGGQMEWWQEILPEISKDTTTFAHNRPGYGESSPAPTPRDGLHIVDELRSLLQSKGMHPPYILVGHSLGGLYMQLFARKYPEEVATLILVDSTHPRQLEGDGAIEKQSLWVRGLVKLLVTGSAKEEFDLIPQTGQQVLNLPSPANKPVYVLSAAKPMEEKSTLADDSNQKRKEIALLYPGSKQIWVNSGHSIPLEDPASVITVIREAQLAIQQKSETLGKSPSAPAP